MAPKQLKQKLQDAAVALSLAHLCLIRSSFGLLYSGFKGYFDEAVVSGLKLLALSANVLLLALAVWIGLQVWRRWRTHWPGLVLELAFLGCLLMPADFCRTNVFEIADYSVVKFCLHPWAAAGLLLLLVLIFWKHAPVARTAAIAVGVLFPLALFAFIQIAFLAVHLPPAAQGPDTQMAALLPFHEEQPRVLWIIFDETDQRLAFDERPPGLKLPEFDRLKGESLYATNAFPPGPSTLLSMPGLISGRPFSAAAVRNRDDLILTDAESGTTTNWSDLPSVFDTARAMGFNSAVVGWYHPYGRVLGRSISFCTWYSLFNPERGRDNGTLGALMAHQVLRCGMGMFYRRQVYGEVCRSMLEDSLSVVTNDAYSLILLHLPGAHPPGVYRPQTHTFTSLGMPKATGYFNNLAMADHDLGQLRQALQRKTQWSKTWVILSADHSWRQSAVYDGRRDLRVPFLLKSPGQNESLTFAPRIETVLTHHLILAILNGKVINQQDALSWLKEHASTAPRVPQGERD